MGGFLEGEHDETGLIRSQPNRKTGVTTTLTNIITIRNKSTYASVQNRSNLTLLELSAEADGTKGVDVYVILGATLGGTPSYTDIDTTNSPVDYDVAGTTVTGGRTIKVFALSKIESRDIDISTLDIEVFAGETITIAAKTSGATSDIFGAVTWREDL